MIEDSKSLIAQMKHHGMNFYSDKVQISLQNAKNILTEVLAMYMEMENKKMIWLDEYDGVAEWLSDNKGRGLFMWGNCGRGKTILGTRVLPAILLQYYRKVVKTYDVNQMNQQADDILSKKMISIDDIGTEDILNSYGNRRLVFAEVIDRAEKQGNMVIITTNLTQEQLIEKYGIRVLERIIATTKRIEFKGKSLRE